MTENSGLRKGQITSNTSAGNFPRLPQPPTIAAAAQQDLQELNKRGPSSLRYCNEQTRLDHDGQLTNRTRGRGSKH
jgi:hypothetical protein